MMLQGGVLCKKGLKRKVNQDRAKLLIEGEHALCFVADGMGGHYAGERASSVLSELLTCWWDHRRAQAARMSPQELSEELKEVLRMGADRICALTPEDQYCGSTIVLLWISAGRYLLMTAGDSRCYQIQPSLFRTEISQISKDDLYHAQGARDALLEGKLTNAIGSKYEASFTIRTGAVDKKTLFALCSDGVYRYCSEEELAKSWSAAARQGNIEITLQQVDEMICAHGAPDNYSLVMVRRK